jgi:hypothetical protein
MSDIKHTPATPLPWFCDGANGGRDDMTLGISSGGYGVNNVVVWIGDGDEQEGIPLDLDAHYIAHAANAYPKLVEALKEAKSDLAESASLQAAYFNADALLRELGE